MTRFLPNRRAPLKLLHWFLHSALRVQGFAVVLLVDAGAVDRAADKRARQSPSLRQGVEVPPGMQMPDTHLPLKQSLLKSQ